MFWNLGIIYLDSIPCLISPLILPKTSAIPIPTFLAIIAVCIQRIFIDDAFTFVS